MSAFNSSSTSSKSAHNPSPFQYKQSSSSKRFHPYSPSPCKLNPNIVKTKPNPTKVVSYRNIHPSEEAYNEIINLITNEDIIIDNLVQIDNPYLKAAYNLKKEQKIYQYGRAQVHEEFMFHGTKKENLYNICTYNFDWRLFGKNTGHKFGQGVSFSPNAMYASNYSDSESYHKVMIVATVLTASTCQGSEDMVVPLDGCDTSQKDGGVVVVKYEDHEFLPLYKVYYHVDEDYDYDESYDDEEEDFDYEEDYYSEEESCEEEEEYWEEEDCCEEEDYCEEEEFWAEDDFWEEEDDSYWDEEDYEDYDEEDEDYYEEVGTRRKG